MRSDNRIFLLPAALRQQVLAMPLTEYEQDNVASALLTLVIPPATSHFHSRKNEKAPSLAG